MNAVKQAQSLHNTKGLDEDLYPDLVGIPSEVLLSMCTNAPLVLSDDKLVALQPSASLRSLA